MYLCDLIPDSSNNWNIKNNFLMYRKYTNIPVCYIDDNIVYIFLNVRIKKILFKFIKNLISLNIDFYFTTSTSSNPKELIDYNNIIRNYLFIYAEKEFFKEFKKMNFDFINNMVKWSEKENCYDLIKPNLDSIIKTINSSFYFEEYESEILDEFQTLYRDIQINRII